MNPLTATVLASPGPGCNLYRVLLHVPGVGLFKRRPTKDFMDATLVARRFNSMETANTSLLFTTDWTKLSERDLKPVRNVKLEDIPFTGEFLIRISDNVLDEYDLALLTTRHGRVQKVETVVKGVYGPPTQLAGDTREDVLQWLQHDATGTHPETYYDLIHLNEGSAR
jgi:hypothetical protein